MEKDFLTFEEVQDFLKCSRSRLYQLLQGGELPAYKIGKLWRVDRSELEEWLETRRYEAARKEPSPEKAERFRDARRFRSLLDSFGEALRAGGIGEAEIPVIMENIRGGT